MLSRFWTWLFRSQTLQFLLIVLLIVLAVVFVSVIVSKSFEACILKSLGLEEDAKYEALKFLGISMGGILIALQALMSYKRAKAMEKTAKSQADAVLKTEQGQRQDRLKNAIEHLGHESDSVRLGGAYELFHLAKDTLDEEKKENLSQTVLDILCAHIRRTTSKSKYRKKHKSKPSEEVQSLLTLLFVQEYEVFKGCHINLQGSWLNGADLKEARLWRARLTQVYLQGTELHKAQLQKANLVEAHLEEGYLHKAQLQKANLLLVRLQGANLEKAQLQGANLRSARLQAAYLREAYMQGANLSSAYLQGATLSSAYLQGATLSSAYLQGADLNQVHLEGARSQVWQTSTPFVERIRMAIGRETDLSSVVLCGGIEQGGVDSLIEGLSPEKAELLQMRLAPHIGKPLSNQLQENSGAITGTYTKEDAEKWIAEYEKAMSSVPKKDAN